MKKILITLYVLCLYMVQTQAQDTLQIPPSGVRGLKRGLNLIYAPTDSCVAASREVYRREIDLHRAVRALDLDNITATLQLYQTQLQDCEQTKTIILEQSNNTLQGNATALQQAQAETLHVTSLLTQTRSVLAQANNTTLQLGQQLRRLRRRQWYERALSTLLITTATTYIIIHK